MKGLIFDFDGTLCNSQHAHKESLKDALRSMGYVWSSDFEECYEKFKSKKTIEKLRQFSELSLISEHDVARLNEKKQDFIVKRISFECLNENLVTLLTKLKKDNFKFAIASDASKASIIAFLKANQVDFMFDQIVTSEDVGGRTKPSPEIYDLTIQLLGIKPDLINAFEDTNEGFSSAKLAGIKVHLCTYFSLHSILEKVIEEI
jgi:beta-phosphoglucomutase